MLDNAYIASDKGRSDKNYMIHAFFLFISFMCERNHFKVFENKERKRILEHTQEFRKTNKTNNQDTRNIKKSFWLEILLGV